MKLVLFNDEEYKEILDRYYEFLNSIVERNPRTGIISYIRIPELDGIRIFTTCVSKMLIKVGLTKQEWVNLHMFGDKDIIPLCPYCKDKPLKFDVWDYKQSCCEPKCKRDRLHKYPDYIKKYKETIEKNRELNKKKAEKRKIEKLMLIEKLGIDGYKELKEKERIEREERYRLYKERKAWIAEKRKKDAAAAHSRAIESEKLRREKEIERQNKPIDPYHYIVRGKRSTTYSEFEDRDIHFDSSWEKAFWEFMSKNEDVLTIIRYHKIRIKYFNREFNKNKHYVPDFLIKYKDGHQEIAEIKPSKYLRTYDAQDKIKAGEDYCKEIGITYCLYTEIELKRLGVLDRNLVVSDSIPRSRGSKLKES